MRLILTALVGLALLLSACANTGPGLACDPCAESEVAPLKALDNPGPSAGASGGQKATNAPFSDETARLSPITSVPRGEGSSTISKADQEHREVASGGAQNAGVLIPTAATASQAAGGIPVAVQSAADTVASLRAALQLALADPTTPTDKIEWIGSQLTAAQRDLAAAQASSTISHVTHNYFQNSRNTVTAVSTSKTGEQPGMEEGPTKALADSMVKVVEAGTAEYEDSPSTSPDATEEGEFPRSEPPAGVSLPPTGGSDG